MMGIKKAVSIVSDTGGTGSVWRFDVAENGAVTGPSGVVIMLPSGAVQA